MFKALNTQERNIHWGDDPLVVVAEIIKNNEKAAIKLKREVVTSLLFSQMLDETGIDYANIISLTVKENNWNLMKANKIHFHEILDLLSDDGGQTFWLKYVDCAIFNTQILQEWDDIPNNSHAYDVYTIGVEQN